jgi:hypothetical protein
MQGSPPAKGASADHHDLRLCFHGERRIAAEISLRFTVGVMVPKPNCPHLIRLGKIVEKRILPLLLPLGLV